MNFLFVSTSIAHFVSLNTHFFFSCYKSHRVVHSMETVHVGAHENTSPSREELMGLIKNFNTAAGVYLGHTLEPFVSDRGARAIINFDETELCAILSDPTYDIEKTFDKEGTGLIHIALSVRSTMCLSALLVHGINPNKRLKSGTSALVCAIQACHMEGVVMVMNCPRTIVTQIDMVKFGSFMKERTNRVKNIHTYINPQKVHVARPNRESVGSARNPDNLRMMHGSFS